MTCLRKAPIAAVLSTLLAISLPATPASSEELTAEQILQRLQAQRARTLGFVDASKPEGDAAQEATALTAEPQAPAVEAPTGLALAPAGGDSGLSVPAGTDPGTAARAAPTVQMPAGTGPAPKAGTTQVTGLQPVEGGESSGVAAAPVDGIAKAPDVQLAATVPGAAESAPSVDTASAEALKIDLTIYFDFDSAVIREESKPQIEALCQAIRLDTGTGTYKIIGHTDARGKASYNKRLSQARADEVVRYMVGKCGIAPERLQAVGVGEEQLKRPDDPASGENRRVEIQVLS